MRRLFRVDGRRSDGCDGYRSRFQGLWDFSHQLNGEKTMLHMCTKYSNMVGEVESSLESPAGDATM